MKTPRTLLNALRSYSRYKARRVVPAVWYNPPVMLCDYMLDFHGISYLGSGGFSVVVQCEGRVFKIVRTTDRGYDGFYEFCRLLGPCDYLPRFKGKWTIRGFTVYELELLEQGLNAEQREVATNFRYRSNRTCDDLHSLYCLMHEYKKQKDFCWDLHLANFAMRGEQLVIIDPWT
jgi:hypothetical protein